MNRSLVFVVSSVAVVIGAGCAAPPDATADESVARTTEALTATVPSYGQWAAVAHRGPELDPDGVPRSWSPTPYAKAVGERSEYLAKQVAIDGCRSETCEIKAYVERGCIAIAHGEGRVVVNPQRPWTWWGYGSSQYRDAQDVIRAKEDTMIRAQQMAKNACEAAADGYCTILDTFCTWDGASAGAPSDAELRDWIADMGGEGSRGIANTLYLVNITTSAYLTTRGNLNSRQASCLAGRARWARLYSAASTCGLTIEQLELLYADAN